MTDVKMPDPVYFTTKNGRLWTLPDEVDQTGLELRIYTEAQMKQYGDDCAREAQQAEQGWQPISTAPKSNPMNPEHRLIFWIDGVGPAFGYAYDDGDGGLLAVIAGYSGGRWEPTHWQAMLAAPKGWV